jgi:hypothetical protein
MWLLAGLKAADPELPSRACPKTGAETFARYASFLFTVYIPSAVNNAELVQGHIRYA